MSTTSKLGTIQAMRGLAALGVTLLHLSGLQMLEGLRDNTGVFAYGWIGVDLFFVISGFIMVWVTKNISSTPKTAFRFIVSRAVRIYPLWWVCVSLVALFFFLVHGYPASPDVISKDFAWGYYARSLLLLPQELAPLLDVGWTLIHEIYFYLVFTFIITLGWRVKLLWALAIWAVITVIGIFLSLDDFNPLLKIIFNPLSFLFIAGAVIGMLNFGYIQDKIVWGLLAVSLLFIFSLILFGVLDKGQRVFQLIIPLSVLLWSAVFLEMTGKIKTPNALLWLGGVSYALYLTHPLVILAWRVLRPFYQDGLFHDFVERLPNLVVICLDMSVLIVACLITAAIFHMFVEQPALRMARRKLQSYRAS